VSPRAESRVLRTRVGRIPRPLPWPCDRAGPVPGSAAVPGTAPMALPLAHSPALPPIPSRSGRRTT
jgi:hypothetical protein